MQRNAREDDQRVVKRQRLLLESLLGVAQKIPESNALESAIAMLEKRRAHCITELQKQKETLKELDDQIHQLRNTDRQDVTMATEQDTSLLQLPYEVIVYILEFFDLPNYRPFYGSFSSTECIKLFFGFFKYVKCFRY
jgi:predicted  nucleic acid-binding Zn-ribbon protein